ncbi:MAG: 30S ribosomal protein S18 [Nitrospirae bacterium]|nr:30S ribosomal protein S18 [Nitrospirota bacterium]
MPRKHIRRCRFCSDLQLEIDWKNVALLRHFVTERFKLNSARQSRVCAWHQRKVKEAVKRARKMALIPYTVSKKLPPDVLFG